MGRSGPPKFWYHRSKDLVQTDPTNSDFPNEAPCSPQHSFDFRPATNNPNISSQQVSNTKNVCNNYSQHPDLTTLHTLAVFQSLVENFLANDFPKELKSRHKQIFEAIVSNNDQLGKGQRNFRAKRTNTKNFLGAPSRRGSVTQPRTNIMPSSLCQKNMATNALNMKDQKDGQGKRNMALSLQSSPQSGTAHHRALRFPCRDPNLHHASNRTCLEAG